jgi:hypothetical protein
MQVRILYSHVATDKEPMILRLIRAARKQKAEQTRKLPPVKNAKEARIVKGAKRTHGGGADN